MGVGGCAGVMEKESTEPVFSKDGDAIRVMVNGLPGKMASKVAEHISENRQKFSLIGYSLTGAEIEQEHYSYPDLGVMGRINLIKPDERDSRLKEIIDSNFPFISVDFTHPSAVNSNGYFYCRNKLPFVMGTTGGDRKALEDRVKVSDISAVIAPNMAKQIVAFQERMQYAAENFSNALRGYHLEIVESHQKSKADTSGTAASMVETPTEDKPKKGYFNLLGIPFTKDQIIKIRDPEEQRKLGVPEHALEGHGWHTYIVYSDRPGNVGIDVLASIIKGFLEKDTSKVFSDYKFYDARPMGIISNLNYIEEKIGKTGLFNFSEEIYRVSEDGIVSFSFHHIPEKLMVITHNVNGRDIYARGTLDAIKYLDKKVKEGSEGQVYSMIDVLKGK